MNPTEELVKLGIPEEEHTIEKLKRYLPGILEVDEKSVLLPHPYHMIRMGNDVLENMKYLTVHFIQRFLRFPQPPGVPQSQPCNDIRKNYPELG